MQKRSNKWLLVGVVVFFAMVYFAPFLMFMLMIVPAILFIGYLVLRKLTK